MPQELFESIPDRRTREGKQEQAMRVAKYSVLRVLNESMDMRLAEDTKLNMATADTPHYQGDFISVIKQAWSSRTGNRNGITGGDIELVADELGVLEIIWPFDEDNLRALPEVEDMSDLLAA